MFTNWKTTVAGLIAGLPIGIDAVVTAFNAGTFTGKTGAQLLLAIGIVLGMAYAKDHNGTPPTAPNVAK